ncbi:helix-turn-helix domain-containing protein [Actinocrispum wychmicini]|uniref:Helix-turn-helix protein n=1 Tax=Actinocrispum wychmicini TaxID=1213861 RepID=A0A4R2JLB4_9PSEU|nr:helix-turn-helix transcriptional regulator [Actinocrispum wychmicini]TCO54975.1 helix-turn-helix protein [Actinocrispum wychmicini]
MPTKPDGRNTPAVDAFVQFLERLRDTAGMTYAEIAAAGGPSERTLTTIFGGENVSWNSVKRMCATVGATDSEIREAVRLRNEAARELKRSSKAPSALPDERARALRGAGYLETLRQLYNQQRFPLLHLFGADMPICAFPTPPDRWDDVESAVGDLLGRDVPTRLERDKSRWPGDYDERGWDRYAELVAAGENNRRWDGPTWALDTMHIDSATGAVRIDCVPGRYYRSLATSELLDAELMNAVADDPDRPVGLERLPRRAWLHQQAGGPDAALLTGRHRCAAVSVAAAVVMRRAHGYDVLLTPRSEDVETHKFFNHVIPAGIFQPLEPGGSHLSDHFVDAEFTVRRTFEREYIEELFDAENYADVGGEPILTPANEPEIQRLRDEPSAKLYYTGVSLNLLTLRPEICLLLLITDPGWLERETATAAELSGRGGRPMHYGWEIVQRERDMPPGHSFARVLSLDTDLRPIGGQETLRSDLLVPNAAAAISLALDVVAAKI